MEARLTLSNLQIRSRNDEDNPVLLSLVPVAVRAVYDRYLFAFGKRQLVGATSRIIV
jgi:hypothetical protein